MLAEQPRGAEPRYWEDVAVGRRARPADQGPDRAHRRGRLRGRGRRADPPAEGPRGRPARLRSAPGVVRSATRAPVRKEPIYSVHYNRQAANAMGVAFQYDVGFQRQCWQIQHLTHWAGDAGWVKSCERAVPQVRLPVRRGHPVRHGDRQARRRRRRARASRSRPGPSQPARRERHARQRGDRAALPTPAKHPAAARASPEQARAGMSEMPTLEEFTAEAEAFLSAHYPREAGGRGKPAVRLGRGQRRGEGLPGAGPGGGGGRRLPAIRALAREPCGTPAWAGSPGPPSSAARGCPAEYQRAFEALSPPLRRPRRLRR